MRPPCDLSKLPWRQTPPDPIRIGDDVVVGEQLYSKNNIDLLIHAITNGYVYGVRCKSEHRGKLNDPATPFDLVKCPVAEFIAYDAELVTETFKATPSSTAS